MEKDSQKSSQPRLDAKPFVDTENKTLLAKGMVSPPPLHLNGEFILKHQTRRQHMEVRKGRYQSSSAFRLRSNIAKSTRNADSKVSSTTGKSKYFIFNDVNNLAQSLNRNSKVVEPLFRSAISPKM